MASLLWRAWWGRRERLGGRLDGLDDEVVAAAAAEVPGQHLADLLPRRLGPLAEEGTDAHDDSRGAIAALEAVLGPERLLDRGQTAIGGGQPPARGGRTWLCAQRP